MALDHVATEVGSQAAGILRVIAGVMTSLVTIITIGTVWIGRSKTAAERWHRISSMPRRLESLETDMIVVKKEMTTNSGTSIKDKVAVIERRIGRNYNMITAQVEADPGLAIFTDAEGEIIAVSAGYSKLTGLTTKDAQRGGWKKAVHPDDLEGVESKWAYSLAHGELFVGEFRLRHISNKLGGAKPVECVSSPQPSDTVDPVTRKPFVTGWACRFTDLEPAPPKPFQLPEVVDAD